MFTRTRRARGREAGFSFIELLVTIIIAGIAFAAMVPLFVQAQQAGSGDKMRTLAMNIAQDRTEKLRQLDFELVTTGNLTNNDFYFGEFGSTWTEQTESGTKQFTVNYDVADKPVSATDARIAYKLVTVTVDWVGLPKTHKPAVLTTMIYRQYAGPDIVDFSILQSDLGTIPGQPEAGDVILLSPVHMQATVNAADLDSMKPTEIGVAPNQRTVTGRVDFLVTSSTGVASPTISVPYTSGAAFPATWDVPGGDPGAGDGYYTFKAVAFSALGSPGNSWELTYRVETGAPPVVRNLAGTASLDNASLTWDASTTGDVDHYVVRRAGMADVDVERASGSIGWWRDTFTPPVAVGTPLTYQVYAVDWMGNESAPASIELTAIDPSGVAPNPAIDLQGQAVNNAAHLQWTPPLPGPEPVVGYVVYQTIGGTERTFTTTTASLDVLQGWDTTALYQVKPYVAGNVESLLWASILAGQPSENGWLKVVVPPETRYTLQIQNTTHKTLSSLRLYYLGPAGTDPQQGVQPPMANVPVDATSAWSNLAAGKYRWDWMTSNSKEGSQTGWCAGANLTIQGSTP